MKSIDDLEKVVVEFVLGFVATSKQAKVIAPDEAQCTKAGCNGNILNNLDKDDEEDEDKENVDDD